MSIQNLVNNGSFAVRAPRGIWTVRIGYQEHGRTQWHPTESTGPFSVLTRGHFYSREHACEWATKHLGPGNWEAIAV